MATRKKKTVKDRPKQTFIKGAEPPRIAAIDKAADLYVDARDERMAALEIEVDRKSKLLELMKKNKLTTYRTDDDQEVNIVESAESVKVRKVKTETDE